MTAGVTQDEPGHILLVDDEPAFQRVGSAWLKSLGHQVTVAGDAASALARFKDANPDIVLLDLAMPPTLTPEAGLALIPAFNAVPVIVITAHADHDLALRATEAGAWDFIAKPVDPDMLRFIVGRAVQKAKLDQELAHLRTDPATDDFGLIGQSDIMQRLRDMIRRIGPTSLSVVILGPTGTGKELVARALHRSGQRRSRPFIPIHCGSVPNELLESELFGHLKGSFTGAHRDQSGLVEAARGGTLFLDEVGEMPPQMQVKLLRFLQEGTYLPVGARETRTADVRVIAATHRNLVHMVEDGSFRDDLYYRLKGVVLQTSSLAERREDIPQLANVFLKRALPKRRASFTPEAAAWLAQQPWPGNVRELQSCIACAAALAQPRASGDIAIDRGLLSFDAARVATEKPGQKRTLDAEIAEVETRMITDALRTAKNNRSEAARVLGISRVGLAKKIQRLGLHST
jgi:two-component system NtrC family response regulator